MAERLRRTALFQGADLGELQELARRSWSRTLKAGDLLWTEDDKNDKNDKNQCPELALVWLGRLIVTRTRDAGRRIIVGAVLTGEVVGIATSVAHAPHTASVVAAVETQVRLMHGSDVRTLVETRPQIALNALRHMGELVGRLTTDIEIERRHIMVRERLIPLLLRLTEGMSEIKITQTELADHLGCERASVTRALQDLEECRLFRRRRGVIQVLELPVLRGPLDPDGR